jgi:DNA adenine methylase
MTASERRVMTVQTVHRQFGSKVRVVSRLLALLPTDGEVWVEGFAGTAAMTLGKEPHPVEHVNDLNGDVVNLFGVMRSPAALEHLCRALDLTPWAQQEFESCRDAVAAEPIDAVADPIERARQFLVASWQGIGGKQHGRTSWRLDIARGWMPGTWSRVPLRLRAAAERLRQVHIHRRHITDLVGMFAGEPRAVLFLDPPYPRSSLVTHERMYAVDMGEDEHRALAEQLRGARCRVLLTMNAATVYSEILADWHTTPFQVRGLRNTCKTELALTNYRPPMADLFGEEC